MSTRVALLYLWAVGAASALSCSSNQAGGPSSGGGSGRAGVGAAAGGSPGQGSGGTTGGSAAAGATATGGATGGTASGPAGAGGGSTSGGVAGRGNGAAGGVGGVGGTIAGAGGAASQGGRGNGGSGANGGASGVAGAAGSVGPTLGTLACGQTWTSAAKGDTWTHDPTLTREGSVYYMFHTRSPVTGGRLPFATSPDGVTWTNRPDPFSADLPWWSTNIPLPEIWAPDIRKVNGTYYLYYSVSAWNNFNSSIGLATNTTLDPSSPTYRWQDRGKVIDFLTGGTGVNVIDPNLFVDDDGSFWLVYGSYRSGLRLVQLDPATGKLLDNPPAPTVLTNGLGEGSSLIKHNGYYYLFASAGICCAQLNSTYHVVMGRSRAVKGPYMTRDNRRMLDGVETVLLPGDANHPGQGGQSFYEENGQLYIVYHAYTRPTGDPLVNVRPIFFDTADWPTLDPCMAAR